MILLGYDWVDVALGILYVSLALLIIVIAYKKLLQYLGKGEPNKREFCVLYALENDPVEGEATFYFTSESAKEYKLKILDQDMQELEVVKEGFCTEGGNIVRYDSTKLPNGKYYYSLVTDNQKTSKQMNVKN